MLSDAERERAEAQAAFVETNADLLSTSAQLRQTQEALAASQADLSRVELECAELRDLMEMLPCGQCRGLGLIPAEAFGRDADGAPERDEEAPCPEGCEIPGWLAAERNDARDDARLLDLARAELARALAELERLRRSEDWLVARDSGRDCVSCEQEIRRGEAYEVRPGFDELVHVRCPTQDSPRTPAPGHQEGERQQ